MNAIFVAKKPINLSSNLFLSQLKRKYKIKKAGFSGTLDPFASGNLIIAFGIYTKLFNFLQKEPKIYKATMWIGATSNSLDNENIKINPSQKLNLQDIKSAINELQGEIKYKPPIFSAKNINGKRAYDLARKGEYFELEEQTMIVFDCEFMHYYHPFLSFKISVNQGAYIRSYSQILAKKLNINASLSSLERIKEGNFIYENEKFLDPLKFLNIKKNLYLKDENDIFLGKKLKIENFKFKDNGFYLLIYDKFFSIIKIENDSICYCLNRIPKMDKYEILF